MKHVKQYESLTNSKLKRYCIWDSLIYMEILEIIDVIDSPLYNTEYVSITKYRYENGTLIKKEKEREISFYDNSIKNYIKYTSDNIQDCIDVLYTLVDIDKYNL